MGFFEIILKLILSIICGGIIGWERQLYHKPAGLRTHILVCIGAAMFTMSSIYIYKSYGGNIDPTRIAAQVVTGIGFIGAGTIWLYQGSIKGLTTAATLWSTAAVGLAIGCGFYLGAILTTIFVIIVLILLGYIERIKELEKKE
jgi:putative Mg2+ transporter-C (MgtC) family protein